MIKRILVGVDGSQTAEDAARKAADLATQLEGELHVLVAHHEHGLSPHEAPEIAEQVAVALRHLHPRLIVDTGAAQGRPADALVRAAEALDADLIVVGNRRVQGLARVLGSVASDVARKAPCDVYVAHTSYR